MLGALGLDFIPQNILGLPIVMGIKTFIKGDNDEKEAEEAMVKHFTQTANSHNHRRLGIDGLAMYVPFSFVKCRFIVMAIIFVIATGILCY